MFKKIEKLNINKLSICFMKLETDQQNKLKKGRKGIIKLRVGINEIENKYNKEY